MPEGPTQIIQGETAVEAGGSRPFLLAGPDAAWIVREGRADVFAVQVLDEATCALDNRTQTIVSRSLEKLQATRVVIAHRLSTIINADRIYVLDHGRVVQSGTYEQLLNEEGLFADKPDVNWPEE